MPDEWLDVVDENNVVIGRELRTVVHRTGLWHRGVSIFLFTRDGKLLVQKRSKDKDTFPSALDCSVSEHVQAGEDYDQAAVRGLEEELGIQGVDLHPLVTFRMSNGSNDNEVSRLYEGIVDPATVHFDRTEIERVDCYNLTELMTCINEHKVSISRWFEHLLLWYLDKPSDVVVMTHINPK